VIVSFVISFNIAVFVPIADDEEAEKTQLTVLLSRCLISSSPQPLNHSPFFSNLPYFSLVANPTSPWLLILYLHRAVIVSCLILRRSAVHLLFSHIISPFPRRMSIFVFLFYNFYLESYICSYTLFYNFQRPVFLLLISEFDLVFFSFLLLY
jgi:hypothetical protein